MPIDSIPNQDISSSKRDQLCLKYQSLVDSLNWLAHTTRPDLSNVVSLLAQHQGNPSPGHYDAALYVVKYLATTENLGIDFTSVCNSTLESFLHFSVPKPLLSKAGTSWGPQDATLTNLQSELPLFASHSISVFYIDPFTLAF
jgi:hypothetical protein